MRTFISASLRPRFGFFAVAAGLMLFHRVQADATLPFYEPFAAATYPDGARLSKVGPGEWNTGNSTGTGQGWLATNTAALTYPGLVTSNESGVMRIGTPGSGRDAGFTFITNSPITLGPGTNAYVSFLLAVTQLPTNTTLVAHLYTGTSGGGATPAVGLWLNSAGELLVTKNEPNAPAASATSVSLNTTDLIVMRYRYVAGASNDVADLWVNPGSLGVTEANVPPPTVSTNGVQNKDVSVIGSFFLSDLANNKTGTASGTLILDEIRVGLTWADVTPSSGLVAPPLYISAIVVAGPDVILSGGGGTTNGNYSVLTTTNVATARANWSILTTGQFDANGNFATTNAVDAAAQRFYLIQTP